MLLNQIDFSRGRKRKEKGRRESNSHFDALHLLLLNSSCLIPPLFASLGFLKGRRGGGLLQSLRSAPFVIHEHLPLWLLLAAATSSSSLFSPLLSVQTFSSSFLSSLSFPSPILSFLPRSSFFSGDKRKGRQGDVHLGDLSLRLLLFSPLSLTGKCSHHEAKSTVFRVCASYPCSTHIRSRS